MKCYFVTPNDEPPDPSEDDTGPGIESLPPALLARHGARVLDPTAVPLADHWPVPRPTVYRARTLLIPPRLQQAPFITAINDELLSVLPVTAVLRQVASNGRGPIVVDAWTALTALRDAVGGPDSPRK